ncbi:hypothetical protein MUK42_36668 [Musa troglodytarum]|uniref:Uncharacterized protein n=1 Tax=Musa troglodytarum TaxID=320322 RepID=A0A9E7GFG4_9LILI|nr:hypothetical protein MUK42_36668 [Musa troglodytarum]
MGNCQASEAAVIQHLGGRVKRLYWQTSAAEVMKNNPGYHVALVTLCVTAEQQDLLMLGQVYWLIISQSSDLLIPQ